MNKIVDLKLEERKRQVLLGSYGLDEESIIKERQQIKEVSKEESERLGKELYDIIRKKKYDEATQYSRVEDLVHSGANVNYKDKSTDSNRGNTPLLFCSRKNKIKTFTLLVRAGADINQTNSYGTTCTMSSARHNNYEILQILIALKADLNARCYDGDNAIMSAKRNNSEESFRLLEEAQVYLNNHNIVGESILNMKHNTSPTIDTAGLLLKDSYQEEQVAQINQQKAEELLLEALEKLDNLSSLTQKDIVKNSKIREKILTKH